MNGHFGTIKLGAVVFGEFTISGNAGVISYGFFDSDDTGSPPTAPLLPDSPPVPEPDTPPQTPPDPGPEPDGINGTSAGETLKGASANDAINGNGGNNKTVGKSGNDTLNGGSGRDNLIGNRGDDVLIMDDGDTGKGGSGADTYKVSLSTNDSVLIRGFSITEDQVLLDTSFSITSAFYPRAEVDGDGKNNDMILVLQGGNGKTASVVFADRCWALKKNAGIPNAEFSDDGRAAIPDEFDDFSADHGWISIG